MYKYKYKKYKSKYLVLRGGGTHSIKLVMYYDNFYSVDLGVVMDVIKDVDVRVILDKLNKNPCFNEFNISTKKRDITVNFEKIN